MWWDKEGRLILAGCELSSEYFCFCPSKIGGSSEKWQKNRGYRKRKTCLRQFAVLKELANKLAH